MQMDPLLMQLTSGTSSDVFRHGFMCCTGSGIGVSNGRISGRVSGRYIVLNPHSGKTIMSAPYSQNLEAQTIIY